MPSTTKTAPVANPTWYGQIRDMFTSVDRNHMAAQGLDLASYDAVMTHAGDIYQQVAGGNMPPHNPWSTDWVGTFLNWMNNGYPKGTPAAKSTVTNFTARGWLSAAVPAARIRKDITTLSSKELDLLKKAFSAMVAKDPSDPNSFFVQAAYHWFPAPNTYCMHHVPGYNPWHRAYLVSFENALRSTPGCENVTLPYWDITTPFPEVLKSAPFDQYVLQKEASPKYPQGYTTQRFAYDVIAKNLLKYEVTDDVNRAMSKTDWEDFHGYWSGAAYNTIIAAHDAGHNSIGPTMQDQGIAAFDPVFWFFHCNWDRLFWEWQKKMEATNLHGLLTTINEAIDPVSYQIFTVPALQLLNPFTNDPPKLNTVTIIDSVAQLDIDYHSPAVASKVAFLTKTQRSLSASKRFTVAADRVNVRVSGVNRLKIPGSFSVHLQKDGKTIASKALFQPEEAQTCASCVANALAHFDFELPLAAVQGGKLSVWVEPVNQDFVGDRFPQKLMGDPTIDVTLLLKTE
ncbi:tyrosinase family protein [Pseudomonas gingeri]|uniref:Tyrosinase family protein n=1 Tax=Pseudomonas gingeri TaxID=117681 RepID=A0A7Y7YGK1_9PSED|nr:tyrosinase family protein [Pseudomonas gingeri]NWB31291.1 tyrosinase family protein [Pseudomonas gingeri]NWC35845.1 tyrosinase family protein [Pseudomonas gingeri]